MSDTAAPVQVEADPAAEAALDRVAEILALAVRLLAERAPAAQEHAA